MKNVLILFFLTICVSTFAQTGDIVVNVSGVENGRGKIKIGLYNSDDGFPAHDREFTGADLNPSKTGGSYTFTNIPEGTYAIAIWHDKNDDGELNRNMFGIPKEHYGFSKNKYGNFGPPDFDEVSFRVEPGKSVTLDISLK